MFKRKEKPSYTLTPISTQKAISKGVTHGHSLKRKILKITASATISITGLITAGLITLSNASAANAGWFEDMFCDSYKNDPGWGTTQPYAEGGVWGHATRIQTQIIGGDAVGNLFDDSQRLTAYEKYGTSGTNFSIWASVDREDIGKDKNIASMWNTIVGANENDENALIKNDKAFSKLNGNYPTQSSAYWQDNWAGCVPVFTGFFNGAANLVFMLTETGTFIVNTIYGMALSTNSSSFWLTGFYDALSTIVLGSSAIEKTELDIFGNQSTNKTYAGGTDGLINQIYLPYLLLILTLATLYLFWHAVIKMRFTKLVSGSIWMVAATIGGWMFIVSPTALPRTLDNGVLEATNVINTAITSASLNGSKELCKVDEPSNVNSDGSLNDGLTGKVTQAVRQGQCLIWYSLVYQPWVIGNYGYSPNNLDAKDANGNYANSTARAYLKGDPLNAMNDTGKLLEIKLGNHKLSPEHLTWPLIQLDMQSLSGKERTPEERKAVDALIALSQIGGKTLTNEAGNEVALNEQPENTVWKGSDPFSRMTMAVSAFFALIGTSILVVLFCFRMILYQISMLFLMFVSPFVALIAVHPGFGKRIAIKWVELVAGLTIKRVIAAGMISVFLMFYGLVMEIPTDIFLIQWILIAAVTAVGLIQQRNIFNSVDNMNWGGRSRGLEALSSRNLLSSAGKVAEKAATGAAVLAHGTPLGAGLKAAGSLKGAAGSLVRGSSAFKRATENDQDSLFKKTGKALGGATLDGAKIAGAGAKGTFNAVKATTKKANSTILGSVLREVGGEGLNAKRIAYAYENRKRQLLGKAPTDLDYGVNDVPSDIIEDPSVWYANFEEDKLFIEPDEEFRNEVDASVVEAAIDASIKVQEQMLVNIETGQKPFTASSDNLYNEVWLGMDETQKAATTKVIKSHLNIMKTQRKLPNEVRVDVPDFINLPYGIRRLEDNDVYTDNKNLRKYSTTELKRAEEWLFGKENKPAPTTPLFKSGNTDTDY